MICYNTDLYNSNLLINYIKHTMSIKLETLDTYIFSVSNFKNLFKILKFVNTNKTKKLYNIILCKLTQDNKYYNISIELTHNKILIVFINETKISKLLESIYKNIYFYEFANSVIDTKETEIINNIRFMKKEPKSKYLCYNFELEPQ